MQSAIWSFPTTIDFGIGKISQLPVHCQELGISRPLLVTDKGLGSSDQISGIQGIIQKTTIRSSLFCDVQGNPVGANVQAGIDHFKGHQCDGVIAVGGGSAMDVAKAIALMGHRRESLWQAGGEACNWTWIPDSDIVPVIAIPTTAGTGSEVGRSAVITDETARAKRLISHPALMPERVISDPQLTAGLPASLTAATGLDAFVHCFEAFCAPGFHPMADGIALEGMRLIAEALPRAVSNGNDLEARGHMLIAASMGAVAFQKDLGGVHALAHSVGVLYNLHHGLANAILLPYVMQANRSAIQERVCLPARVLNLPRPDFDGLLNWVLEFREQLGIPHSLKEAGIPDSDIVEIGERSAQDLCAPTNPIIFSAQQYSEIFTLALKGKL